MIQLLSEVLMVSALKKGEVRRAVELMLDSYNDDLFGYCARMVGLQSGVPVYHSVLSTAIEELGTFDGQTSLRAWLYGIARRVVLQHFRNFPSVYPEAQDLDFCPISNGDDETHPPGSEEVLEVMAGLDPHLQEVLQLSFWQGLHLAEVSHMLGAPLPVLREQASQALQTLGLMLRQGNAQPC